MNTRCLLWVAGACVAVSMPISVRAQVAKPAATRPAEPAALPAATVARIRQLVVQLGDADYAKREAATRQLKAIGKPAIPALRQALADPDIEIVSRAQALLKRLEGHALPGGPVDPNAVLRPTRMRMSAGADARVLEVSEAGRDVKITQSADGIAMTVTGDVDGERVTEEFTAKDVDQLRRDNPEAYALYERWTGPGNGPGFILRGPMQLGGGGGRVQIGGIQGGVQIVGPGVVVGPAGAPDELDLLRLRLEKQFREKNVNADDRDKALAEVGKLADARMNGDMEGYSKQADEVRKALEGLKLDAGDLLPPPAKSRLGVSVQQILNAGGEGLTVARLANDSRGERIGLKVGDVIKKVDGQAVASVAELRKAVMAKEKGLVIEVSRDGAGMKLEEKAEGEKK